MKGFRKFLSVMLVCSMLAVPPTQGVTAADYGNGSVEASAEICAEMEETGEETGNDIQDQEEAETEATEPEEDGGEEETGETPPEGGGAETGKPANPGETQDDDENIGGAEEDSAGETGAEDTDEETEETEADGAQGEAAEDVLLEQGESVAAETFATEGGETSGSCGANVTWRFEDGVLTISGSGAMEDYGHESRVPWHDYCANIKQAVVEEDITAIGEYAFSDCSSLTDIELPSSVVSIGACAFSSCSSLASIKLPSDVIAIGKSAFSGCSSLTSIELPSGITTIDEYAFFNCSNLTDIELPSDVTIIGMFAFSCCSRLISIELPSSVTAIGGHAFEACSSLTSIKLPSGVTIIEESVFERCNSLTSIELPSGITTLEERAFRECSSLTNIELPSDVTTIGVSAFQGCSSLISIELPPSVTAIGEYAFYCCNRLKNIKLPSSITTIGEYAFCACGSLTNIVLPLDITTIENGTFLNCSSLTSIEISSGVMTIGESVFYNCTSLKDVYYGGNESDWRAITIGDNNEPLTSATINYNSSSPVHIHCGGGTTEKFTHNLDYYVSATNSSLYSPELSHMLIAMSCAAYDEGDVKASMKELGFQDSDIFSHYNKEDLDRQISYAFGKKTMSNGETLVLVTVRGSSSSFDWLSNFNVGVGSWHMGFESAVNEVYDSLADFMGGNLNGATYVVTGHSRGAAVANLLEIKLFEAKVAREKVYGYNFACPDVARAIPTMWNWLGEHDNMFNIGNAPDPVTMVPGVLGGSIGFIPGTTWGKFGQSRWFSKDWNNINEIALNFSKHDQKAYLEHLRDKSSFDSFKTYEQRKMTIPVAEWRSIGKLFNIRCPVDVNITDQNGNTIASVIGGEANYYGSSFGEVMIFTDGDKKAVFVQGDEPLEIHLTATDSGTMAYTVQTLDYDLGEVLSEKVFDNVALTDGKQMLSIVDTKEAAENGNDVSQVPLFVLDENDNIIREVLPDGAGTEIPYNDPGEVLQGDIPADGKIPDGLWIAGVEESYTYTGAAIKPEIRVYDGKKKLQPGKDYTASYKNNMKANDAFNSSKAPAVVVKGKGNYAGTETATFKITAATLSDSSIFVEDMTTAYNKKVQKRTPVLTYNGRKLAKNRDFTVSYPGTEPGAYKEAGVYEILLTAKADGNFSGTRTVVYTITDSTLIGKVSVKKIPNQTYTGAAIEPELTVTYKNTPLVKGTDYTVSYTDHTEIGTAKVVLTGIGKYTGTKKVSFRITGTPLKGIVVSGIENKVYNGNYQEQNMTVTLKGRKLEAGTDYETVYAGNREVGKASVTIKGKGAYTGTIKKTFRIGKFDIAANKDGRFTAEVKRETVPYAKGGVKPAVTVKFRTRDGVWQTLSEGKDYTLSYRNHTVVNDGSKANKQPAVTVKGKGNFSGTYGMALGFQIAAQDLGRLTLAAQDKTFQNKKNSYATKLSITDLNGTVLKAGTDYQKAFTYLYKEETEVSREGGEKVTRAAGTGVDKEDIIPAGTVLRVRVEAKAGGNYTGALEGEYRITKASLSSASVSVPKQVYTREPITLEKSLITVKMKGKQLDESQYEIVPGSYKNNVQKGTASVTLRGVDNYGGTKTVKFTIRAKGFLWWWR